MAEQGFRTVGELADELRVSRLTLYRRIHSGELEAVRVGTNGPLRVSAESVGRLLRPASSDTSDVVSERTAAGPRAVRSDGSGQSA